jgi:DNA-directed RNA polymerase
LEQPSELTLKTNIDGSTIEEHLQFKTSVIWTNPLRMPIVQPYRKSKARGISTNLQKINISEPHKSDPVSKRKQLQAFPPNFIHSLDATHMILSALKCEELGLSFAAVHDSFWTHAGDIDAMNDVLRDAFIKIHSENVIGRLAAEFAARYKGSIYLAKLSPGSPVFKRIQQWRSEYHEKDDLMKRVKGRKLRELILERRRARLLQSSDPLEIEEGKKMVTPGSIFEDMATEREITGSNDLTALGLGEVENDKVGVNGDHENIDASSEDNIDDFLHEDMVADAAPSGDIEGSIPDEGHENRPRATKGLAFTDIVTGGRMGRAPSVVNMQWIWLPLTFSSIPKRVCI